MYIESITISLRRNNRLPNRKMGKRNEHFTKMSVQLAINIIFIKVLNFLIVIRKCNNFNHNLIQHCSHQNN